MQVELKLGADGDLLNKHPLVLLTEKDWESDQKEREYWKAEAQRLEKEKKQLLEQIAGYEAWRVHIPSPPTPDQPVANFTWGLESNARGIPNKTPAAGASTVQRRDGEASALWRAVYAENCTNREHGSTPQIAAHAADEAVGSFRQRFRDKSREQLDKVLEPGLIALQFTKFVQAMSRNMWSDPDCIERKTVTRITQYSNSFAHHLRQALGVGNYGEGSGS